MGKILLFGDVLAHDFRGQKGVFMRVIILITVVSLLAIFSYLSYLYFFNKETVEVHDPCDSFGSQYLPFRTPRFERSVYGNVLLVSLSPAMTSEVSKILSSTRIGDATLEIFPSRMVLQGVSRDSKGNIVIPVSTKKNAIHILKELCFTDEDIEDSISRD